MKDNSWVFILLFALALLILSDSDEDAFYESCSNKGNYKLSNGKVITCEVSKND